MARSVPELTRARSVARCLLAATLGALALTSSRGALAQPSAAEAPPAQPSTAEAPAAHSSTAEAPAAHSSAAEGFAAQPPTVEAPAAGSEVSVRHTRIVDVPPPSKLPPDPEALALSAKIDSIIYEVVQDLGLNVDISERTTRRESDEDLLDLAKESWVVAPKLERSRGHWLLRIVAAPPGSRVLYSANVVVEPESLDKRIVLAMRDLMEAARGAKPSPTPAQLPPPPSTQPTIAAHSPGRAILAVNAALLGGFAGYSLQRASGSTDDRLTYPLAALGAGVGLGSAMLVAEEWDIEVGDAWFLSAGMLWPTLSASFIARGYDVSRANGYGYGLLGATAGITLASTALSFGHVSDGGAALAHSGGVFGTLVGGLVDLSIQGKTDVRPRLGMGYGAGAGVILAGAIATQLDLSPSRVLMIDLGASLGALTGAAAASPLLLVDESAGSSRSRNRWWLASIAAGTVVGGAAGVWFTRSTTTTASLHPSLLPSFGVMAISPEGTPAYGAGVHGTW